MLASVRHILPMTVIRRVRQLDYSARILVRKGQVVNASDTVAEAYPSPEHFLLDVARGLGLPPEQAETHIQCQIGAQLAENDLIAGPIGVMRRVVLSPVNGTVVLIGNGQVLIEIRKTPFELKAGFPGDVEEILMDRGVVIETTGALVQGVWGNGHMDQGLLHCLLDTPKQRLTADQLNVGLRGLVLIAGHCSDEETLKAAADLPLKALILASMTPSLTAIALRMKIPVVVIEGFGDIALDTVASRLLTTNEKREAYVLADSWNEHKGTRPEIIIPLPAAGGISLPDEVARFSVGQKVRVVRAPLTGIIGTIQEMVGPSVFPGGTRALAAEVQLENGERKVLPLVNLEVLA